MYHIIIEHRYVLPVDPREQSRFTSVHNCPIVNIFVSKFELINFKTHIPDKFKLLMTGDTLPYVSILSKDYELDNNDIVIQANGNPIDAFTWQPVVFDWWTKASRYKIKFNKDLIDSITATHSIDIAIPGESNQPDIKNIINFCDNFILAHPISNSTITGYYTITSETKYSYPAPVQSMIQKINKYIDPTDVWKDSSIIDYKFRQMASSMLGGVTYDPAEEKLKLITKLFNKL